MKFKDIASVAEDVKAYTEKHNKLPDKIQGLTKAEYSYILLKSVLNPGKEINKLSFKDAPAPNGDSIAIKYDKKDYQSICNEVNKFINANKRLPNYITFKSKKININLSTYANSKIIKFYDSKKRLPDTCRYDSSIFKSKKAAPTIKANDAYTYFVKKTGFKGKTIDEVLAYVKKHGKYSFYFNGHRTNKQITDSMTGNCTDWLQWLINIAEALGYEWKCIHVKCIKSGTGHVRGQFKHKTHTGGNWINRDPAAVADGGAINSIWCGNGIIIDKNPSWFMETLRK